jgi:hypothetical protein
MLTTEYVLLGVAIFEAAVLGLAGLAMRSVLRSAARERAQLLDRIQTRTVQEYAAMRRVTDPEQPKSNGSRGRQREGRHTPEEEPPESLVSAYSAFQALTNIPPTEE